MGDEQHRGGMKTGRPGEKPHEDVHADRRTKKHIHTLSLQSYQPDTVRTKTGFYLYPSESMHLRHGGFKVSITDRSNPNLPFF